MWLKAVLGGSAAVLSVGFALGYLLKTGPRPLATAAEEPSTHVMCSLNPAERDGRRQQLESLWARAEQTEDLDNGYAFHFAFDDETLREITNVISLESGCCRFFEFQVTARPARDELLLEITGPEGTRELLGSSVSLGAAQRSTAEGSPRDSAQASCCPGCLECSVESAAPGGGTE